MTNGAQGSRAVMIAIAAIGAMGVTTATSVSAQDKTIRIGVLMPISGPASYFGVQGKEGRLEIGGRRLVRTDMDNIARHGLGS